MGATRGKAAADGPAQPANIPMKTKSRSIAVISPDFKQQTAREKLIKSVLRREAKLCYNFKIKRHVRSCMAFLTKTARARVVRAHR
eukprot:SAG11_NODE_31485_length_291_cov_1.072917_1_plen_85_part_01